MGHLLVGKCNHTCTQSVLFISPSALPPVY